MLDTLGMNAAIENYVKKFSGRSGIPCELTMSHNEFEVNDKVATSIFRLLQEALNNVLKHARASKVRVDVQCSDEAVTLAVEDDGVGLPETLSEGRPGYGLPGMRERVATVEGQFSILSRSGHGVRVEVVIPTPKA
jgi:signal transduction histidine kinase